MGCRETVRRIAPEPWIEAGVWRLFVGFTPRRTRFDSRQINMGFIMDTMALVEVSSGIADFLPTQVAARSKA
jgi:hypothetical protein